MEIQRGERSFKVGRKVFSAEIRVFPPRLPMPEIYDEAVGRNTSGEFFIYRPDVELVRADLGYKLPATTKSSLGTEIPVHSKELWFVPESTVTESVELILRHLRAPRPSMNAEHLGEKECEPAKVLAFLKDIDADASFRLFAVRQSSVQFLDRIPKTVRSRARIDPFIEFCAENLGAYSAKNSKRWARNCYKETGVLEIGYAGTEEDC